MDSEDERISIHGYCPICERETTFIATNSWYRDSLLCQTCKEGSAPRERALAYILKRELPNWRNLVIHESSPAGRGISLQLKEQCSRYVGSTYFPDKPLGAMVGEWRNEDICRQTFVDASFDVVVSLDVAEHVFDPEAKFKEIYRTLKKGGLYIATFPIHKSQVVDCIPTAKLQSDGKILHLVEKPEYHGNPFSDQQSLVTISYGYEIHKKIAEWTPFSVEITRFFDQKFGIIGDYTEVVICRKLSENQSRIVPITAMSGKKGMLSRAWKFLRG